MKYKLKLDIFEGPLDLLLYLIKKNDIDIKDIPIVEVTEQYMQYIEMMKILNLDVVGDFLVMAATLMQIKSRMLLPQNPEYEDEDEPDPKDELIRRLYEYKKFKELAEVLQKKERERSALFSRGVDEKKLTQLKEEATEIYFDANLFDLISALTSALNRQPKGIIHEIVVKDEATVEEKIHKILHCMIERESILLTELFEDTRNKIDIIVTFLAILELIRLKEIRAVQKKPFKEIKIIRNKENIEPVHN